MKRFLLFFLAVSLLGVGSVVADPINIEQVVTPDDLTKKGSLSWDTDEGKPIGTPDGGHAPGFGDSAFYSGVTGSAMGGGRDYTALRIGSSFFGVDNLTIGDINSFTYWTKNTNVDLRDWQVKIYTKKSSFFGSNYRLNFNPGKAEDNEWTQWSLFGEDALGLEHVRKINWYGAGSYVDKDLSRYLSESIDYIDIIAGYKTNSPEVRSYLDGVKIAYRGNNTIRLNLESRNTTPDPVPEPATVALLSFGLLGIGTFRRRNEKK